MENLAPGLFALIVFSILAFALGYAIVDRMPDGPKTKAESATNTTANRM